MTNKQQIECLREDVKYWKQRYEEANADREWYRKHFMKRLKWWLELLKDGKTPNLTWLIEDDIKFLGSVQRFTWWGQ